MRDDADVEEAAEEEAEGESDEFGGEEGHGMSTKRLGRGNNSDRAAVTGWMESGRASLETPPFAKGAKDGPPVLGCRAVCGED